MYTIKPIAASDDLKQQLIKSNDSDKNYALGPLLEINIHRKTNPESEIVATHLVDWVAEDNDVRIRVWVIRRTPEVEYLYIGTILSTGEFTNYTFRPSALTQYRYWDLQRRFFDTVFSSNYLRKTRNAAYTELVQTHCI